MKSLKSKIPGQIKRQIFDSTCDKALPDVGRKVAMNVSSDNLLRQVPWQVLHQVRAQVLREERDEIAKK